MAMSKPDSLGEFEQFVLLAILRLGQDAYGMRIREEIETQAKRSAAIGAIYITLDRLIAKKYVSSSLGEVTPERGGRAKRFYKVEALGMRALRNSQAAVGRMMKGLHLFQEAI